MTRWTRRTAHVLAGLACAAALTGCGADKLAEEGIEKAIEEAASGEADVEFDSDGNVSVENEDGSFQVGSSELPEGFPTDDVPVADGDILTSSRFSEGEETTWSVTVMTGGDPGDAFADARDDLTGAGYDETQSVDSGTFRSATLEGASYRVNLTAVDGTDGATLSYSVASGTE